ncbi:phosphotransferase family protein [Svornostia abyssi]|uniref:Phosphotransferase family protein n=1 Tax=Svornostia abyssi TaxID=2898438 RepID=A0ABY5PI85_9ACTN|nr:phosphotransferase family protein [Parviterribacteraceae bacterium J379]
MSQLDAEQLVQRLEEVYPEVRVSGTPRRLSSGASRETWRCTADTGDDFIVQLQRGAAAGETDEAELLRAAADVNVPVPKVLADGADDPVLGTYMVTSLLPGTEDPRAILAMPDPDALLDDLAGALAAIHTIDLDDSGLQPADQLVLLRHLHDGFGQPHPVFDLAFRRLEATRPPAGETTVVHGDFRLGNLLVEESGLTGVLDWELAHLGDPASDLGWLCVRAWRFGRPDRPAAGLGSRAALLDAYARASGRDVSAETLAWWEMLATLRWGDHHRAAGVHAPVGTDHVPRARRHRAAHRRGRMGPARPARRSGRRAVARRRARALPPTTAPPPLSCCTPPAARSATTSCPTSRAAPRSRPG